MSALESDVRCWTPAKWATLERTLGVSANSFFGVTDPFTYDIHLHGYVCDWIHLLIAGEPLPNEDDRLEAATWLVLLTHEAEHLTSAGSNERLAECRAVQDADKVGAALGIDEAYAQELSKLYWEKVYPTETDGYRSPECRNGGSMDQNPDISAWP